MTSLSYHLVVYGSLVLAYLIEVFSGPNAKSALYMLLLILTIYGLTYVLTHTCINV